MGGREPSTPPQRPWNLRQYSISTLLVMVMIVAVVLGVVTNRAERQRRAVAAIRELGGTVTYDFEIKTPNEPPGPDRLCRILGVDYFADVVRVQASDMTDAACSHLSALTSLQVCDLAGSRVTDASLAHLAGLTRLRELQLDCTEVGDAGLVHLAGLTSLQLLWLINSQVTDASLVHLAGLNNLESLALSGTHVSDSGLAYLAGRTNLQFLALDETQVTNDGCQKLQQALPNCWIIYGSIESNELVVPSDEDDRPLDWQGERELEIERQPEVERKQEWERQRAWEMERAKGLEV